jgi:hypothetical protein
MNSIQNDTVWKMVLSYIMWCLSRERNNQSYKDSKQTELKLKVFSSRHFTIG